MAHFLTNKQVQWLLDAWAANVLRDDIAGHLGVSCVTVWNQIIKARAAGDGRAVQRTRGRRPTTREAVLALAAKGIRPGAIAEQLGTTVNCVASTLSKARRNGDPRAVRFNCRSGSGEGVSSAPAASSPVLLGDGLTLHARIQPEGTEHVSVWRTPNNV